MSCGVPWCLLLVAVLVATVHCEVFSALATLTKALYHEKDLADSLRHYVELERIRLQKVLALADDYDKHADEALVNAESYIANPINAYLFVKRFTTELPKTKELVSTDVNAKVFMNLLEAYKAELPDEDDLEGVVAAILRLQDTYQLTSRQIADGTFTPTNRSPPMSAKDCFHLGRFAYGKEDWYHMFSWMYQSLDMLENEENKTLSKAEVLDYLSYAATMQGNIRHAKFWTLQWLMMEPDHERARNNIIYFNKEIEKQTEKFKKEGKAVPDEDVLPPLQNKRVTDSYRSGQEFINYEALCRGEDVTPNPYAHKLKCYYTTSGQNPILVLAPVKVEEYYLDPYIVLYHDVVSDKEIEIVKEISIPKLARATVNDPATGNLVTAHYRVSRSAWLKDNMNDTVRTLTKRMSAVSRLDFEKAEDLQIQNYGIGGQYEPHCDHARPVDARQFEEFRGNRVATMLIYFSEVDAGGLTVFTQIGAKVPPKKGSAAFWFNLKPDGQGDDNTRHAGCPVLAGSKWVANKWYHERGQEFMRPCGLQPN